MQPLSVAPRGYRPYPVNPSNGNDHAEPATWLAAEPATWLAPEPLVTPTETEPYPLDALPTGIRQAVEEVQQFVQAPTELVTASALTALSIAGQQLADVRRAERLCGPLSLYFLSIAESGERKSSVDGHFMRPIREHERTSRDAAKGELANHVAEMAAWEASKGAAVDRIGKATKDSKDVTAHKADLAAVEGGKPAAPKIPRLLYADVTSEKLTRDLATNWPAAGIVSSEGGAVLGGHSMGKDSAMRTMSAINTLWDGGSLAVDRATTESFEVRNARLTVGIQVQPGVLSAFMEGDRGLSRGSGFLARFLFSAPSSTQGTRQYRDPPARWPSLEAFNGRIADLLNVRPAIDDDGGLLLPLLDFTPEAKKAWIACHDAIEGELGPTGDFANVRDLASKAADNIARLAALFHVYELGAVGGIGVESVNAAARIVTWHLYAGRNYLGAFSLPPVVANAAALDRWLTDACRRDGVQEIPRRTILQYGTPRALRDNGTLTAALAELTEHHRAREFRDGKRKVIRINPLILVGESDAA